MAVQACIVCLLSCLALASAEELHISEEPPKEGKAAQLACEDCSATHAQVSQLTAEVSSLREQLAAVQGGAAQHCEISVMGAISKTGSIAGDMINHLLKQTDLDEKMGSAVSGHVKAAKEMGSNVVDQITAHPCGTGHQECIAHVQSSSVYQTHFAPHVKTLEPHLESAKVYVNPAMETAAQAYKSAAETLEVQVVPTLKQNSNLAIDGMSSIASSVPGLLDPAFVAVRTASPDHHHILPRDPVERALLIFVLLPALLFNLFFAIRFGFWIAATLMSYILIPLGIKLPWKVTKMSINWGFFFGTGFYVCGLCRKRKKSSKKVASADAKAEPKKNAQPATMKELVQMLEKTKEKGKLSDGAAALATAAQNGKPLKAPEEMKGKVVSKDVLKKALANFKGVDIKKLGL